MLWHKGEKRKSERGCQVLTVFLDLKKVGREGGSVTGAKFGGVHLWCHLIARSRDMCARPCIRMFVPSFHSRQKRKAHFCPSRFHIQVTRFGNALDILNSLAFCKFRHWGGNARARSGNEIAVGDESTNQMLAWHFLVSSPRKTTTNRSDDRF